MRILSIAAALAAVTLDAHADAPLPDGRYSCLILGTGATYMPVYNASVLGTIALRKGEYVSEAYKGGGKVTRGSAGRLRFAGGPLDGWVAFIGSNSSGPFIRFREKSHGDPGEKTEIGDHLCFLRKS